MRIHAGGNVDIKTGNLVISTSGKGIDFSAGTGGGSTNAILDDYEEGTWTPTCVPSGGDGSWPASSTQGYYTKVGSVVHVQFVLENFTNQLSTVQGSAGGGAVLTFGGLPFANQYYLYTPHIATWGFNYPGSLSTATGSFYCYVADNTTNMQPYFVRDNATGEQLTVAVLGQAYIRGQFSYRTSA